MGDMQDTAALACDLDARADSRRGPIVEHGIPAGAAIRDGQAIVATLDRLNSNVLAGIEVRKGGLARDLAMIEPDQGASGEAEDDEGDNQMALINPPTDDSGYQGNRCDGRKVECPGVELRQGG